MNSQTFLYESERLTKAQKRAFISAYVGWVFDFYEVVLMAFMVIPLSRYLHLPTSHMAYVFSTQLFFLATGGVVFGLLSDRFGRRPVLMWTILVYALGTLARAATFSEWWLLLFTAVAGLGIGGEYAVGQALVSEVMPTSRRGWWGGMLYGGCHIGSICAALVGGYVMPVIGWRWTLAASSLPVFWALYVRKSAPESDVWEMKKQKESVKTDWHAFARRSFLGPFAHCLIASCLQFFAYYGITMFLPTFLVKQGFSLAAASWWWVLNASSGLVGSTIGAYTCDRWGRRVTLSFLAATASAGGLIIFFSWHYLIHSWWILIPFIMIYTGTNGGPTVFGVLFSEKFPTEIRTTGIAASLQLGRGMAFIPPLITAAIFPVYGYAPVVLIGAAEFGLLSLWAWTFKETKGKSILTLDAEAKAAAPADVNVSV